MFNSFCRAALIYAPLTNAGKLPFQDKQFLNHLLGRPNNIEIKKYFMVINWKKGGCFNSSLVGENFGMVAENKKKFLFASQISTEEH